jgi:hypothetical protein
MRIARCHRNRRRAARLESESVLVEALIESAAVIPGREQRKLRVNPELRQRCVARFRVRSQVLAPRNDDGLCESTRLTMCSVVVEFADVRRLVQFDADLADEVDLGLEEVDVVLLVLHQLLE